MCPPVERLLVTTALEASWSDTEPMLFLGEWCRLYSRSDRWSDLDAPVAPYHWDDWQKYSGDCGFLASLHEELLAELSECLNEHHEVDHSLRYWRILLGPWLGWFTQTLFDRWESIHQAVRGEELSGTVILTGLTDDRVPNDMDDFLYLRLGQGWNHHQYARVLVGCTDLPHVFQPVDEVSDPISSGPVPELERVGSNSDWRVKAIEVYSRLAERFTRPTDFFVTNAGLRSLRDELILQRRLGQVPRLIQGVRPVITTVDDRCRRWRLGDGDRTDFQGYVRNRIPEQIPTVYLEGYKALCNQVAGLRWPSRPKAIFTSAAHFYDDAFKLWCAERTEGGAPLVVGQHGGHVGTAWSFNHDHQVAIADRFLSWGWSDPNDPKVVPVGVLKAPALPETGRRSKDRALLVLSSTDLQSYEIMSTFRSGQFLEYLDDQFAFVEALSSTVRDALTVRLSVHECGWENERRWRDRTPEINLDDGRIPIMDLVAETRLCIATTNTTTYLESFFLDIPTVIFWNTSRWEVLDSAVPYFDELARVGIFHDSPKSAASHVSEIWSDVGTWWSSDPVVRAVSGFSERYCRDSGDVLDAVKSSLVALTSEL